MLGPILLSFHNLRYYQRLVEGAREAIMERRWGSFKLEVLNRVKRVVGSAPLGKWP